MDIVEAYEMMNGMCEDERGKELNVLGMNVNDTRYLLPEEKIGMRYT